MDELLIEEKIYVSSKRAAKVTGYAKDYIGQLCREGRVPARLVGRSWYVLESAIHDHRFGDPGSKDEVPAANNKQTPTSTWESPRYEAAKAEILPSVNRLRHPVGYPEAGDTETVVSTDDKAPQHLQDSWKAWFDRVATTEAVTSTESDPPILQEQAGEPEVEQEEISIPIHTIYELPPEDFLPRHAEVESPRRDVEEVPHKKGSRGILKVIQMTGVVLAMTVATIAAIGTGYFDTYIISNRQVSLLAGVAVYNK